MELAVTFPVVLLLVMTLIQAALWFYARSVALGAAQEGAREGRVQPASTGAPSRPPRASSTRPPRTCSPPPP